MTDGMPESPYRTDVSVGELKVARAPGVLVTMALGSCVGVALWDPFALNGGLAHVMLPGAGNTADGASESRFAGSAIPLLVERLRDMGSLRRRLVAKIAGGASMFASDSTLSYIGERNIAEVRVQLEALGIPVEAEDVGGSHARTVELHLDSGTLVVRSYAFGIKEL